MTRRRDEITNTLRQRLFAAIHLGVLRPGDRLASVRATAAEVDADPRLILTAYRQLEREGLVELRPRSGIYVAMPAAAGAELSGDAAWFVGVFADALSRGIAAADVPETLRRSLLRVRLRACCIECNDDQITGLCHELQRDYGFETDRLDVAALGGRRLPPALAAADVLVTTSFHAEEVRAAAERVSKPSIAVALRPEFRSEMERLMKSTTVYFVASDIRFEAKLASIFALTTDSGAGAPRVMIVGRDRLETIPRNAPMYVTQQARLVLDRLPAEARIISAQRVFCDDSARELLSFVIGKNLAAS